VQLPAERVKDDSSSSSSSDDDQRRPTRREKKEEATRVSFWDSVRALSTSKQEVMSPGKHSQLKRELHELRRDLQYNKEYGYMYEESSDDGGKISAMRHPELAVLRNRTYKRPGYKEPKSCCYKMMKSPLCQLLTSREFWFTLICSSLIMFVIYIYTTPAPYCNPEERQGCAYNKLYLPWECKPCPKNALCDSGSMTCKTGFVQVSPEVCLSEKENPFVLRLVRELMEMD